MYPLSGPSCTVYILGDVQTSWIISRVTFHHAVNVQHLLSSHNGNIFKVLHDSGLEELWALCLGTLGHWILSPWVLASLWGNVSKHQGLESWGRSSQRDSTLYSIWSCFHFHVGVPQPNKMYIWGDVSSLNCQQKMVFSYYGQSIIKVSNGLSQGKDLRISKPII